MDTFEIRCDVCGKVLESPYTLESAEGWYTSDGATLCPEHNAVVITNAEGAARESAGR